jgi:uncharacterized membrane protein
MVQIKWPFFMMFFVLVTGSFMIPAYAEVNSFQTDQLFYTPGNKIYFTGTVGIGDYQKQVNLVIHDPMGKFVLISGNYSDSIYTFEIVVNTNDTNQFSTKGTYSATAFVGDPSSGKTIAFDFSPDGSPVIHQVPQNTNTGSTNSGQQTPQHFVTQLNENIATSDVTGNLTKMNPYSTLEKSSTQFDFKNILYPMISLCGVGIVIAVIYFKKINLKPSMRKNNSSQQSTQVVISEPEDDDAMLILKKRLAKGEITLDEFKAIKDALSEF